MTDAAPIVFVVDDDHSVRKALKRLFTSVGYQVQSYASPLEFLEHPLPDAPSCAVLDVQMPGLNGLDLQSALVERNANLPIVFLTGHGTIPTGVHAMKAGAVDFLEKPFNNQVLLHSVQQAIARQGQTRKTGAERAEIEQRLQTLSDRERQVLDLVVRGLLNKQIGQRLGVTEKTVKVHRAHVMRKMRATSLAELVRMTERIAAGPSGPGASAPV
jgi:RNA polymerase sigma factor (sigma-70 family)